MAKKNQELEHKKKGTELVKEIVSIKDLIKNSDGIITYSKEAVLKEIILIADKCNINIEEATITELRAARTAIRKPRYDLDKIGKHNNSVIHQKLTQMKADNKKDIEELLSIVSPIEENLHNEIERRKKEAEEKEQREKERKENIKNMINEWEELFIQLERDIREGTFYVAGYESKINEFKAEFMNFDEFVEKAESLADMAIKRIPELKEAEESIKQKAAERAQREKIESRTQNRVKQLFSIGMMFNGEVYIFENLEIHQHEIEQCPDDEWEESMKDYQEDIERFKRERKANDEKMRKLLETPDEPDTKEKSDIVQEHLDSKIQDVVDLANEVSEKLENVPQGNGIIDLMESTEGMQGPGPKGMLIPDQKPSEFEQAIDESIKANNPEEPIDQLNEKLARDKTATLMYLKNVHLEMKQRKVDEVYSFPYSELMKGIGENIKLFEKVISNIKHHDPLEDF